MVSIPKMLGNEQQALIKIEGMSCTDCEHHIKTALEGAGAMAVEANWERGEARFTWAKEVSEEDLKGAVHAAGYQPKEITLIGTLGASPDPTGSAQAHKAQAKVPGAPGFDYDLVIVGAGSAAFAGAIKAKEAGYSVALIERGTIGGTCVNIGCVPSKALLKAGEIYWQAGHHPLEGVSTTACKMDLGAVVAQKDDLVTHLRQAKYTNLIAGYGFDVIQGNARFTSPSKVEVNGNAISAQAFIVATGASPAIPPIPGLETTGYLTSTTALDLTEIPGRLAVIGANAIGLELGQFFQHIGSEVTFIDVAPRIAPFEEPEVSDILAGILTSQGAMIHAGAQVLEVKRTGNHIDITIAVSGKQVVVAADQVLIATGRQPNTAGLGLETAGVAIDSHGAVIVDSHLRTANPVIFAAGDVTGAPQFVYVSAYEGALAVDNAILGATRDVDFSGLPRVTFTLPQVASAGVTEAQARESGAEVIVSVLPLSAVPRALVNHETAGLVKLVADGPSRRLLGATVLSDAAGEIIQSAVLAIRHDITVDDLASTFHPYLTMVESIKLAAQTFDRDVSKLSCCAA
ncbi:MAG: mercury(II) reductase [Actinobacteria bacterium]|nr:mercury(II) reductase [Actinomycetota bacterium]MCL5446001.1 mercury(II) reductase [Actinomycetota bacterium]